MLFLKCVKGASLPPIHKSSLYTAILKINFEGFLIEKEFCPENENEIFIIGGEQIYKMAMPISTNMHITKVHNNIKGDAFFPAFDENEWNILTQKDSETNEGLKFSFIEYQKIV